VHQTGFWFLEEPAWAPPAALSDFLSAGDPPVYVGFGSIGDPAQAARTTALVIEALQRAGKRGVLATGWNAMTALAQLPDDIFMLESAPHAWLFPRMAAVVHHGGAGTTAAGLRSGVPSIVITHGNDTLGWGKLVYDLGVGGRPIPKKKLTAQNLAEAIQSIDSKAVQAAAAALGESIRGEQGAETAARIIMDSVTAA
jgi:sterol 3beta-glucosyltransferase